MAEEKEYNLGKGVKEIGVLYPAIADARGRIIDGIHRLAGDSRWPVFVLEDIDTDEKYLMARIISNTHRREVPAEEKTKWLGELAEKTGWTPKQLADKLGMSYSWIMKYLPDRFKERPGAGPIEYPVTRRVTQPHVSEAVTSSVGVEVEIQEAEAAASLQSSQNLEAEPVKEPKPKMFKCRACLEEFEEPVRPVHVTLCPDCEMRFQIWKADRETST